MVIRESVFRSVLCIVIGVSSFGSLAADATLERETLAKGFALGVRKRGIWSNLHNPLQRDQLYEPLHPLRIHLFHDISCNLFVYRSPELRYGLGEMINLNICEELAREALEQRFSESTTVPDPYEEVYNETYAEGSDEFNTALALYNASVQGRANDIASDLKRLLNKMTFQEHRIGFNVAREYRWNHWYASIRSWFGIAERNYWLNTEDRDAIAGTLKNVFPEMDGKFDINQFMTVSAGIGDIHTRVGYVIPLTRKAELSVGFSGIIPLGREGHQPTKNMVLPLVANDFKEFARKRVNDIFISPQFGNGGHFGIGAWTDFYWQRLKPCDRNKLQLQIYGGVDYLFDVSEDRFLLNKERAITNDSGTELTLFALKSHFMSNDADFRSYINQYVIPSPVTIVMSPGVIMQCGAVAHYKFEKAAFFGGYDFYHRGAEEVLFFRTHEHNARYSVLQDSDGGAHEQHKFFCGWSYNAYFKNLQLVSFELKDVRLSFSLQASGSLNSLRMGKDLSLGMGLGLQL